MYHNTLANALAAMLGNASRTSTRTNYPKEEDALGQPGITFDLVSTKISVVGYSGGQLGFSLRTMEISNETVVATKEKALQMILETDPLFKEFGADPAASHRLDFAAALEYAGMNSSYPRMLRDVLTIVEGFADKTRGHIIFGASKKLSGGCVAFIAQLENSVMVVQIQA